MPPAMATLAEAQPVGAGEGDVLPGQAPVRRPVPAGAARRADELRRAVQPERGERPDRAQTEPGQSREHHASSESGAGRPASAPSQSAANRPRSTRSRKCSPSASCASGSVSTVTPSQPRATATASASRPSQSPPMSVSRWSSIRSNAGAPNALTRGELAAHERSGRGVRESAAPTPTGCRAGRGGEAGPAHGPPSDYTLAARRPRGPAVGLQPGHRAPGALAKRRRRGYTGRRIERSF